MVIVGQIKAPHGVRGELRVASFTAPAENILEYSPWFVADKEGWRQLDVRRCRAHGDGFVAIVEGVGDRDAAANLRGLEIAVQRSTLPATEAGEYYWRDLIGMRVGTTAGDDLGSIASLMETGANDVLVVKDGDRERLLPFIDQVIVEVDVAGRQVVVDWDPDF